MNNGCSLKNSLKKIGKKGIDITCFLVLLPSYLRPKKEIQKEKINKILLINLQGIGDIVMTTPFLTALRTEFPKGEIHYLCYKGNGDLLEGDKRINKIYKRKEDNIFSKDFLNTLKEIRKDHYDLIINLFPAQHSALLTILSNAKYKLGNLYNTASTSNNLQIKKAEKTWDMRKNAQNIAEQLGLEEYDSAVLTLALSREIKDETREFFRKEEIKKKCVGINPNATWISKNWPDEYWCTFIEQLLKERKYKDHQIVLFGGPGDKEHTEKIKENVETRVSEKEKERIQNIAGKINLKQTVAALQEMEVFITTDSGLLHIACAVGTKAIGLFGCTNPDILIKGNKHVDIMSGYGQCLPKFQFNHNNEPPDWKQECMKKISVEEVLEKVRRSI